jgi:Ca-activated chloride channel family protein
MAADIAPLDTVPAAEPDAGLGALQTSRGNLPLDAVDVRAAIAGLSASVELTQEFHNPFDIALEATYVFPLPSRAAVTAMRMECAGHVTDGVLKERSQARADYDQAIAEGRRAAIAEEERPDVFTLRAGNIPPGERVTVRLTLSQPLPYEDGDVTFRFPLVVAPRYIPGSPLDGAPAGRGVAPDTDAVPDASRITPPVLLPGFPNPVRLTLSADIDPAGLPLAGLRCSLHAVAEDRGADGHTVVRLRSGERLDRDFILRLAVADTERFAASLVLTPDADPGDGQARGTFTLTLVPPPGTGLPRPRDVVLVLDRSGSMHGWKMVAARRAAARIVDTLTGGDRFAVLCFDNSVERAPDLPDGLAEATDRNRFRAIEHLARTDARGGTEMVEPLHTALRLLAGPPEAAEPHAGRAPEADAAPERDRVLILVTDGQVGNEDQILHWLGPSLAGIRVHVVGIDRAVNAGFLGRLASAGGGRCELVESEDRLDEAADRIHRRIGAPLVAGLALAADGLRILQETVAPGRLPDLFPGVPVTITGRWDGQAGGTLTVRGTGSDGSPFEAAASAVTGGTPASTANWARAHLRDLEDRYACLPGGDTAALARLEREITQVSLRHGVLCRFTAFVAVDSRVVTDGTAPHRVTQPVELPSGWVPQSAPAQPAVGGVAYAAAAKKPLASPPPAPIPGPGPAPLPAAAPFPGPRPAAGRGRGRASRVVVARGSGPAARPAPPASSTPAARPASSTADATKLAAVRRQLADEAARLRAARQEPAAERARLLADLATRIDALLAWLAGDTAFSAHRAALTELAAELRDCDQPGRLDGTGLDPLWEKTIRELTALAAPPAPGGQPETPRQPFWKRTQ